MQRAGSITKTMVKCLMAMASLGPSQGAKLVNFSRIYCVARPRICFRSTRKTGIEDLMQQSGKRRPAETCACMPQTLVEVSGAE